MIANLITIQEIKIQRAACIAVMCVQCANEEPISIQGRNKGIAQM